MDRVVIATAAPSIQKEFGFSTGHDGAGSSRRSSIAYAFFQIPGGWLGDRFGPRRALTGVVIWWSTFTAATALTWSAGVDDACAGSCSAWARRAHSRSPPARCRAGCCRRNAAGRRALTHAGARLGGAVTPVFVVLLIARISAGACRSCCSRCVGIVWALLWFWYYRDTPRSSTARSMPRSARLIDGRARRSGTGARGKVPWRRMLAQPAALAAVGDVFLLRLLHQHLPDVVSQIPARRARVRSRDDGLVRQHAADGGRARRHRRRVDVRPAGQARGQAEAGAPGRSR